MIQQRGRKKIASVKFLCYDEPWECITYVYNGRLNYYSWFIIFTLFIKKKCS